MTPVTPGLEVEVPPGPAMGPLTLDTTSSSLRALKYLKTRREHAIKIHPPKIDPMMIAMFIRVSTTVKG